MGGRDLWMSFLVVENLNDADQFILGRDFISGREQVTGKNGGQAWCETGPGSSRSCVDMEGSRIRNPDRKYVKKPINRIITDKNNFFRQKSKTTARAGCGSNF